MIIGAPPFLPTTTRPLTRTRSNLSLKSSTITPSWFPNQIDNIRSNYEDFSQVVNDPNPEEDAFGKIQMILANWAAAFEGESHLRTQISTRIDCCLNSYNQQRDGDLFETDKKDDVIARCKIIR